MFKKTFSGVAFSLLLIAPGALYAQATGRVTGVVRDNITGETVFGAVVVVQGQSATAQTDFEGAFQLDLPPGAYTITINAVSFTPQQRQVTVQAGRTSSVGVIVMGVQAARELVVEGRQLNTTESSMLQLQRRSGAVSDGVSQEAIKKSPDSSASDVLRRVTGISIIGGKFVFVRGLGERYSYTTLNDAVLASPEPDKRVVPLDLFPATFIKNIRIIKTFLPEDSGEFSGGIVKIETIDYPDEFTLAVSVGAGGNTDTTGRQFRTYWGGKTDGQGKDDGTRDRPAFVDSLPNYIVFERGDIFGGLPEGLVQLGAGLFPNTWDAFNISAPFDRDFKLTVGDTIKTGDTSRFGYVYGTSYNRSWRKREEKETSYIAFNQVSQLAPEASYIFPRVTQDVNRSTEEVLWGHNLNLSFEPIANQRFSSKTFYSRNSEKYVREAEGSRSDNTLSAFLDFKTSVTGWIEREVLHQVFSGIHAVDLFGDRAHKFDWNVSFSNANRDEPNLSQQVWERAQGQNQLRSRTSGSFSNLRYYSEAEDKARSLQMNYEIPFSQWDGLPAKLKFGGMATERYKDFSSEIYNYLPIGATGGIPESEFIGGGLLFSLPAMLTNRYRFQEQKGDFDSYEAKQILQAYYGQIDTPLVDKLRFIGGLRYEDSYQRVKTFLSERPLDPDIQFGRPGVGELRNKDRLPSANLVYELRDDMNLRLGYSETVNRPDFRDLSEFGFSATLGGERVFGNRELRRAYIHNYDTRWEWYLTDSEYIGFGLFQKFLSNPIERVGLSNVNETRDYTFVNARNGEIRGAELEVRKDFLEDFQFSANLFLIRSQVELLTWEERAYIGLGLVERQSRRALFSPTNLESSLVGQSEYVYNFKLSYFFDSERDGSIGLLYNVFGDRLESNGANGAPDTTEKGAAVVDLVLEDKVGENLDWKFSVKNILNTRFKVVQDNPLFGREELVNSYRTGVSYSFSLGYKF